MSSSQFTASDVIATASSLIAICALCTTLWQAVLARRHNRLSLRPLLNWHRNIKPSVISSGMELIYVVRNNGIGPAIVKSCRFDYEGLTDKHSHDDANQINELAKMLFTDIYPYTLLEHGLPNPESAIRVGCEFVVAKIHFHNANDFNIKRILDLLEKIRFTLSYTSLYEQKYELVMGNIQPKTSSNH